MTASEEAKDERSFVVGFMLCNTLTRAWETDLVVSASDSERDVEIDGVRCILHASANEAGKLHEIVYAVPATGATDALSLAFRHADAELSRMALQYGRSFEIAGWRVADVEYGARWRFVPFRPSALKTEPALGALSSEWSSLLRLYREARSATSPTWRLIAAGAILDAAVAARAPFDATGLDVVNHALTFDMLARSGTLTTHPEFKGATVRALHDVVEPLRMSLLSELSQLGAGAARRETGDYHGTVCLTALANLADLVARDLVLMRLRTEGDVRDAERARGMETVSA
ncbi:methylamine utilization protein MauJ [Hyphomicrobium nitrativorans]|uniref:methylamine utilization protein MauJ n=1 Tax=Hyphomicrobium nitrativorans TaxID=1427356 RepID=UPI0011832B02